MDPKSLSPVDSILYVCDPAECSYYALGRSNTVVHELNAMIYELVQNGKVSEDHSKESIYEFSRAVKRARFQLKEIWLPRADEICRVKDGDDEMKKIIAASILKDIAARDLTFLLTIEFIPIYRDMWRKKNSSYKEEEVERLADREFVERFVSSLHECFEWFGNVIASMK